MTDRRISVDTQTRAGLLLGRLTFFVFGLSSVSSSPTELQDRGTETEKKDDAELTEKRPSGGIGRERLRERERVRGERRVIQRRHYLQFCEIYEAGGEFYYCFIDVFDPSITAFY